MSCLEWEKPYTVACRRGSRCRVLYQDSPILANFSLSEAELIVAALNGAYNLGRFSITCSKEK